MTAVLLFSVCFDCPARCRCVHYRLDRLGFEVRDSYRCICKSAHLCYQAVGLYGSAISSSQFTMTGHILAANTMRRARL